MITEEQYAGMLMTTKSLQERLKALELEREVNRHLYGLLEKNVAQAISRVEHERDKVVGMLHELNELAKTAASNPLLLTEATFVVDEMLAGISLQNESSGGTAATDAREH